MKIAFALLPAITLFIHVAAQEDRDSITIYFPFDKYSLTPEARTRLDSFLNIHDYHSLKQLSIKGHCDSLGSLAYNDQLSAKRCSSVYKYLLDNGLTDNSVVLVEGYGERIPVNNNSTAEEQQKNRRVELIWIRKAKPPVSVSTPKDTVINFSKKIVDSVKEGQTLRIRNINFYGGSHRFLPESITALNELLDALKSFPKLEIEIQGHICCLHGTPSDGIDYDSGDRNLSLNRARAVFEFLVQNGIDRNRMSYKGFAAKEPLIYPEYSEEDRTMNRRVEIKILKK